MYDRLKELAQERYCQKEYLSTLFELALEEKWFDLQHLIQHDMAKAILADYSQELGKDYLNQEVFYNNWEDVIQVGWAAFCKHTGLSMEQVNVRLQALRNAI
jgi:AraC-like DNA-binding protein